MTQVTIEGTSLGSKKRLFEDFSIPIDPDNFGGGGITLRDLVESTVRQQVAAFEKRQADRKFIRVLTEREIAAGETAGKIDSGGSEIEAKPVEADDAVANALEAFEDGLYLIAIDGKEFRSLDQQLFLQEDSRVTFVRLTMLAGG